MKHTLSKSTFVRGLNCEKSLYLYKHHYKLRDVTSAAQEAIFTQGTNVGELATQLFPGGVDFTPEKYYDFGPSVEATKNAIANGEPVIYEAAFMYDGVLAAMDIMVKTEEGYASYEVKGSTEVKDTYLQDIALQTYIISNCGVNLTDISLVYINNQYVKNGPIDVHGLFIIESVKDRLSNFHAKIPNQIARLKSVIQQGEAPEVNIGTQCHSPYTCDFVGYCWKDVPDYSVMDISNLGKEKRFELYHDGYVQLIDVPDDYNLGVAQRMQVEAEKSGETIIDNKSIENYLNDLTYPIYHLDFETIGPAVPIYDGTRPFRQYVFQYSLHVQSEPQGETKHFEYLGETDGTDPRLKFCEQLISECGTVGDVLAYNVSFERGKLEDLIEVFPQFTAGLTNIISRLKDLATPFQRKWYYVPEMKGRYTIKYVLPALVPELSYKDLEIQEGGTASNTFTQMAQGTFEGDYEKTRKALIAYCKLDTYAMVKILDKLYEAVKGKDDV